ncbi:MAG: hypothetical protein PVI27_01975 [Desulfobacteraceae bacterium]|jgi:hypothetical protein
MRIEVDCYAGYRGEETPRRLRLGKTVVAVCEILDRWLAPDHRYFKLLGDDGARYIVRHDSRRGFWELVFFQHGGYPAGPAGGQGE